MNFGRALPAKDPLARWVAVLSMALNDILLTHKLLAEAMLSHPHRLLTPALEFHPHRLLNGSSGRPSFFWMSLARRGAVQQSSLAPSKDCSKRNRGKRY